MGHFSHRCSLCGWFIWHEQGTGKKEAWSGKFRAVIDNRDGTSFLSGLAYHYRRTEEWWDVPLDKDASRSDKPPPELSTNVTFMYRGGHREASTNHGQGWLFHDACWSLLEEFYKPDQAPIARFAEICRALPYHWWRLSWPHDYGGLFVLDDHDDFPWNHKMEQQAEPPYEPYISDPMVVPGLAKLVQSCKSNGPKKSNRGSSRTQYANTAKHSNCFSKLPWELLMLIVSELDTKTALSLRTVTRSFLPLDKDTSFWRSRFDKNAEMGFLFEARVQEKELDLQTLFRKLSKARELVNLRNRQRIWSVLGKIALLLDLSPAQASNVESLETVRASLSKNSVSVAMDNEEQLPGCFYADGRKEVETQTVMLPDEISEIRITLVDTDWLTYVAGIRLVSSDGRSYALGRSHNRGEVSRVVSSFKGFNIALDARGIRALQVVEADSVSSWMGNPEGCCLTERLANVHSPTSLGIVFDSWKIVSITLKGSTSENEDQPVYQESQIASTIWYPSVPKRSLNINLDSFVGQEFNKLDFRPIHYVHFGGSGGTNLKHLQGITYIDLPTIQAFQFMAGKKARTSLNELYFGRLEWEDDQRERPQTWKINGSGGEYITTIDVTVGVDKEFPMGSTTSVKITTNRKRSLMIGEPHDKDVWKTLSYPADETITGLYGYQALGGSGIVSLGVISEKLSTTAEVDLGMSKTKKRAAEAVASETSKKKTRTSGRSGLRSSARLT